MVGDPLPQISHFIIVLTISGYLRFNQVRIPRTAMLNRHSQVHADGRYTTTDKSKVKYTVMLKIRGVITSVVAYGLAQAVTIATRYSIVRLQGFGPNGLLPEETPIYHYKSQHSRLLTLIAKAYAVFFVGRALDAEISDHLRRISTGDHSKAPAMHALSAGCKAWATQIAADGADGAYSHSLPFPNSGQV
jgi:acyl-CoA oxidase